MNLDIYLVLVHYFLICYKVSIIRIQFTRIIYVSYVFYIQGPLPQNLFWEICKINPLEEQLYKVHEVLDTSIERERFVVSLAGKRVLHVKGFGSCFKDPTAAQELVEARQEQDPVLLLC